MRIFDDRWRAALRRGRNWECALKGAVLLMGVILSTLESAAATDAAIPRPRVVVHRRASAPALPVATKAPAPPAPRGSGMHLYPPPGTNPPKAGVIVPDQYELPPG